MIRNGQMLGVAERRNRNTVSVGSAAGVAGAEEILGRERTDTMQVLGEVDLINYYNDGNKVGGAMGWEVLVWGRRAGSAWTSDGSQAGREHVVEFSQRLHCAATRSSPPVFIAGRLSLQGTGTATEMGLEERQVGLHLLSGVGMVCRLGMLAQCPAQLQTACRVANSALPTDRAPLPQVLAVEGIVICAVDVGRHPEMIRAVADAAAPGAGPAAAAAAARAASQRRLKANVRVTTRGMWVGLGDRLLEQLHAAAKEAVERLPGDAALSAVERVVADALRRTCKVSGKVVRWCSAGAVGMWSFCMACWTCCGVLQA